MKRTNITPALVLGLVSLTALAGCGKGGRSLIGSILGGVVSEEIHDKITESGAQKADAPQLLPGEEIVSGDPATGVYVLRTTGTR